jgi:hypothetical protein
MTDHDKRLVLRGMSIARGILMNESCDHLDSLTTYQRLLADAWAIDDSAVEHRAEFMALVEEINEAIAVKHPDWRPRRRSH